MQIASNLQLGINFHKVSLLAAGAAQLSLCGQLVYVKCATRSLRKEIAECSKVSEQNTKIEELHHKVKKIYNSKFSTLSLAIPLALTSCLLLRELHPIAGRICIFLLLGGVIVGFSTRNPSTKKLVTRCTGLALIGSMAVAIGLLTWQASATAGQQAAKLGIFRPVDGIEIACGNLASQLAGFGTFALCCSLLIFHYQQSSVRTTRG